MTYGKGDVVVRIYDKDREMLDKQRDIVKITDFRERCMGDEWVHSGRPCVRVEYQLRREALKALGVNTVADLQQREQAIWDLVTSEWFRILAEPKVRGHENGAALHPVWERVSMLFRTYFSGAEVTDVRWERTKPLTCDPIKLEKQALGCLSKALACRFGKQVSRQSSVNLANGWTDRIGNELHEKINVLAGHIQVKTGFKLGVSAYNSVGYDVELDRPDNVLSDDVIRRKREDVNNWVAEQGAIR
jgi:hypothetical protein